MIDVTGDALRDLLEAVGDGPVLTLYVRVDPSDPDNQRAWRDRAWRLEVERELSALAPDGPPDDLGERVREWLAGHRPAGRTLVLVADDESMLDVELPVSLPTAAAWGPPALTPLVRAMSDHRAYAAVLVDRESVRILEGSLGFVGDKGTVTIGPEWGMPGATRSGHRFRFEARRHKYARKFHAAVAQSVDDLLTDSPGIERLVLGGNLTEAHGVARALGRQAHDRLVGVLAIPMTSTEAEVAERVTPHAAAFEEDQDLEAVAAMGAARAAGRTAAGTEEVTEALRDFRVRDVLVSSHVPGGPAGAAGLDDVVRGAVLAGAPVRIVHGRAAAAVDEDGGVVARLYYTPPAGT